MTFLDVYRKSIDLLSADQPFVLATVVRSLGSTPQKVGANAIFEPNGKVHGTLGGGCLEAEARRRALDALDSGHVSLFHLKLDDISGWDDGLICGGQATILIQPQPIAQRQAIKQLVAAEHGIASGVLVTRITRSESITTQCEWMDDPDHWTNLWPQHADAFELVVQNEKASLVGNISKADSELLFIEPCCPKPELLIAGAGHVGKAVGKLAVMMGFQTVIVDDRPEFASRENLPDADEVVCGNIPQSIEDRKIKNNTFIVIVTRGHQHDAASLAACVNSPASFIGMIGSRRKSMLIRKRLLEKGIASKEVLDRIVCPIGLDIGSVSVNEIALSIVSQLVAFRRKRSLDAASMAYSKL